MLRHLSFGLALAMLAGGGGCDRGKDLVKIPETSEDKYQYGERMLRETRPDDALAAFLEVIRQRPDDAPESHLEAGRILLNVKNDPVEAIHHFREYLAVKPNSEQAPMVAQLIETAKKQFARSLPGNKGAYDEADLLDQIAALKSDNDNLHRQLAGEPPRLAGAVLQNSLMANAPPPAPTNSITRAPAPPSPSQPTTPVRTSAPPPVSVQAVAATPAAQAAAGRTYTVQSGDTLSSISFKLYGVRSRYLEIYNVNTDQLASPNAKLHIGQVLKLPQ